MKRAISSARKAAKDKSAIGRPRVDATPVNVRFPPDQLARLDGWIATQGDKPSRPEAIRRIVERALSKTWEG